MDLLITGATTSVSDDLGPLRRLRRHRPTTLSNPDEEPTRHVEYRERVGMRRMVWPARRTRLLDDVVHNEKGDDVLLVKYLQPFVGPDAAVDKPQDSRAAG